MNRRSKTRPAREPAKARGRNVACEPRLSRNRKPQDWSVEDWQVGLRRRECLKLPLPQPATLERMAQALGALAAALRR